MKRIFTLLALIGLFISASAQTRALATLSHNGELTFFDKLTALEDAIEAAVDGDIIYLSSGKFGQSYISITKNIGIVGNGYDTHIINTVDLHIPYGANESSTPVLEGLRVNNLILQMGGGSYPIEIKTCKIEVIEGSGVNNILFDRCYITNYSGSSSNVTFRNCKIAEFWGNGSEYMDNCNVGSVSVSGLYYASSCIIDSIPGNAGGTYENCLLNLIMDSGDGMKRYACYVYVKNGLMAGPFLDKNLEPTNDFYSEQEKYKEFVGTDGTTVGVYGGQWYPFTTTPTVPTVDAQKSSVTYDADNHQLKVNITVAE